MKANQLDFWKKCNKKHIFQNIKNLVDEFVDKHFLNVSTFTEFRYLENCKSLSDYRYGCLAAVFDRFHGNQMT